MVPLSFGNVREESLGTILKRMSRHFGAPRFPCAARWLARFIPGGPLPVRLPLSVELCEAHLPAPRAHEGRAPVVKGFTFAAGAREIADGGRAEPGQESDEKDV
jgi:hypothetical protein